MDLWCGDVSTLTSPFLEHDRSPTGNGGSLFSKLSSQMMTREAKIDKDFKETALLIGSPRESNQSDAEPSPIKASDSLFECDLGLSFVDKNNITHDKTTYGACSKHLNSSRQERILSLLNAIDAMKSPAIDGSNTHWHSNRKTQNISATTKKEISHKHGGHVSFDTLNDTNLGPTILHLNDSSSSNQTLNTKRDEWREVIDPESGRTYFYNRKTRVSKWKLPKGAVLSKSKKSSDRSQHSSSSIPISKNIQSNNQGRNKLKPSRDLLASRRSNESNVMQEGMASKQGQKVAKNAVSPLHVSNDQESHFKSPQDCTSTRELSDSYFCMFCGIGCSLAVLGTHLTECSSVDSRARMKLQKVILDTFKTITESTRDHCQTPSIAQQHQVTNQSDLASSVYNKTYDWGTSAHNTTSTSTEWSTSMSKQQRQREIVQNYCVEVDVKTCPFCTAKFNKGNHFSNHLLKCRERKKGRNRRKTQKKVDSDTVLCPRAIAEMKRSTPGRRLPWD